MQIFDRRNSRLKSHDHKISIYKKLSMISEDHWAPRLVEVGIDGRATFASASLRNSSLFLDSNYFTINGVWNAFCIASRRPDDIEIERKISFCG